MTAAGGVLPSLSHYGDAGRRAMNVRLYNTQR